MSKKAIDLSIIILNYNTKELTRTCLESVIQAKNKADMWEVILVDNGSTDGSVEFLVQAIKDLNVSSWVTHISLSTNIGFAAGNNKGIHIAQGKAILLLNSDTEIKKEAIQRSLELLWSRESIGVVTAKLVLSNGLIDPACHRGFPTPWASFTYLSGLETLFPQSYWFSQYHQGYKNLSIKHQVDAISGAFFLIKKEVISTTGLLDEDFFMYGEDLDWAYRIRSNGWEIWYEPDAIVLHKKKLSGRNSADPLVRNKTSYYFISTMKQFYNKHYKDSYPFIVTWIILNLLNLRLFFLKKERTH